MGVNSLPKTVTRQRRDCNLNPGPSAPESSTLITRLPSDPYYNTRRGNVLSAKRPVTVQISLIEKGTEALIKGEAFAGSFRSLIYMYILIRITALQVSAGE